MHSAVGVMGIRFYCPQGHKLNVKAFLAGKRGICPHCGASFEIPLESTRGSSRQERRAAQGQAAADDGAAADAEAEDNVLPEAGPQSAPWSAPGGDGPQQPSAAAAAFSAPPVQAASPDPLTETPGAVWYVRPPGGGQFGPAPGELLRSWMAEGRISADSLVWREGWPDWREAGELFPHLQPAEVVPGLDAILQRDAEHVPIPDLIHHSTPHRDAPIMWILIAAFLGLIAVGVLILVYWMQNS